MIMTNSPITVLIAEDEPVPRRRLARLGAQHGLGGGLGGLETARAEILEPPAIDAVRPRSLGHGRACAGEGDQQE